MAPDPTDQDFAEAMEIVEAVQQGRPHQPVEMRHLHAVVNWGARLEQDNLAMQPYVESVRPARHSREPGPAVVCTEVE